MTTCLAVIGEGSKEGGRKANTSRPGEVRYKKKTRVDLCGEIHKNDDIKGGAS